MTEKVYKAIRLCLDGNVITMYDKQTGEILVRYNMKDEQKAKEKFLLQTSLLDRAAERRKNDNL